MRLRHIKLSGFKSFVDPTTLIVPGNLTGIVGPNGCGKSNIIDAVTWVMGESSAKHLRGDSLTDVIFNGSGSRQPVGQASVELTFENAEGKLGGQYASYSEISIKRTMNREGISNYYLNNSRCRRKDITAIFLGTGIGPRSYSIIEQGMISRLIEAKPEELRSFIEEAAGISKFRERRRETENRIRHTRDNIARLNDIREELGKQLDRLKRQARAAERYQVLKQEERQLKAELLALNWQELDGQIKQKEEISREKQTKVEEALAHLRQVEASIEHQRQELATSNDNFNEAQSAFYQLGSEISQVEQRIHHTQERIEALNTDLNKSLELEKGLQAQRENDQSELAKLNENLKQLEPQLHGSRSDSDQAYTALNQAEQAMQSWQSEWDAFNEAIADFDRQLEVDSTRLQHMESGIEQDQRRSQDLKAELEEAETKNYAATAEEIGAKVEKQEASVTELRGESERLQKEVSEIRDSVDSASEQLSELRSRHQVLSAQKSSLEALQSEDLQEQQEVQDWLSSKGLQDAPRLIQQIDVEPNWALAVETVLGHHLQDIYVESVADPETFLAGFSQGRIGFVSASSKQTQNAALPGLAEKVTSDIFIEHLFRGVYVAENIEEASEIRKQLEPHESVITRDGTWLGVQWLRVHRQSEDYSGALTREQQIQALTDEEQQASNKIESHRSQHEELKERLNATENRLQEVRGLYGEEQQNLAKLQTQHVEFRTRQEQLDERVIKIKEELDELSLNHEDDESELSSIRHNLQKTRDNRQELEGQRNRLTEIRDHHKNSLNSARGQWQSTHEQSHEIALQLESISSQRASLEQAIKRSEIQLSNQEGRTREIRELVNSSETPLASMQEELAGKLKDKVSAEQTLSEKRTALQEKEAALRKAEQARVDAEQQVQERKDQLAEAKMSAQDTRVRLQTVSEQLQDQGFKINEMLEQMDEAAEKSAWQERLEAVERKINRLGPINLAAIDEFEQLSERKEYLDKQDEDLNEALQTLETAIKKIDKETRTRFKETFDFLNTNLKEMFPVLFGGGHAYLELTGDDLLETGVSIMARPPGKRNSTIHLLSGGEKALTAVALVFAIFKLNPAPFCILDEVDAPLDDSNTARFSELLKQMSGEVQFIFITHNKITMEIARQLLGVTMYEPGVSRLVSVDVDEAVEMAASA